MNYPPLPQTTTEEAVPPTMTISKTIPKPRNWQDFEKLCKKLFGSIWGCSASIKANGRSGYGQQGVDIYGVPKNESAYWGVQCKGKDDYLETSIKVSEVDTEILKAKKFNPPLATFIIATTANKDIRAEEHVRKCDLASRTAGGFAIQLLCWEDLVDLIEESRETYNWWVREKRHREQFDADISFNDERTTILISPTFLHVTKTYAIMPRTKLLAESRAHPSSILGSYLSGETTDLAQEVARIFSPPSRPKNLSWCSLSMNIKNTGQEVIDDYKVEFTFDELFGDIFTTDSLRVEGSQVTYFPKDGRPLTQGEKKMLTLEVKPKTSPSRTALGWKLFARDFSKEGTLTIISEPEIKFSTKTISVLTREEVRTSTTFEDVLVYSDKSPQSQD